MPTLELQPAHRRVLAYLNQNPWWHTVGQLQDTPSLRPGDADAALPDLIEEGYAKHIADGDIVAVTPRGTEAARFTQHTERAA
ncbi:MAG TPA: hypothetical protein VGC15_06815 [Acetobacteraceae bacterium]